MTNFYTVSETAKLLQVTPRTVHNLIERGHFPGSYKIDPSTKGSHVRIPKTEVEAYIQSTQPKSD